MSQRYLFRTLTALLAFAIGLGATLLWLNRGPKYESFDDIDKLPVPTVAYCDLRNNPEIYSGKIVRVEAEVFSFRHGSYLYNEDCQESDPEGRLIDNSRTAISYYPPSADHLMEQFKPFNHKFGLKARAKMIGRFTHETPEGMTDRIEDRTSFKFEIYSVEMLEITNEKS